MALISSTTKDFFMSPNAVVWTFNALGDKDHLSVSVFANAKLKVFKKDIVDYNPDDNYREWEIVGYNTYFDDTDARYCHFAIEKNGSSAMLIYAKNRLDFFGRAITDDASAFIGEEGPEDATRWFVFVGKISDSLNGSREWDQTYGYVTGELDTDAYRNSSQDEKYLSKLHDDAAKGMISFENGITIGKGRIWWDDESNAIVFESGAYSKSFLSAFGKNDTKGGGGSYERLDDWNDYTDEKSVWVLSAALGVNLKERLDKLNLEELGLTQERLGNWDSAYNFVHAIEGTSADDVINTWEEIKAFVAGLDGSSTLEEILRSKLDVSAFTQANIKSTLGISDWALAASKPSYAFSELTSRPTTLGGYGITDAASLAQFNELKDAFDELFTKVTLADGTITIRANYGLWSNEFISAFGVNTADGLDTTGTTYVRSISFVDGKLKVNYGNITEIGELSVLDEKIDGVADRVAKLENSATKVSFEQTLSSGEKIGTIIIDNEATELFAPSLTKDSVKNVLGIKDWALADTLSADAVPDLDWSKIATGKPTTISGYGITIVADDVPALAISKITGLQTALDSKLSLVEFAKFFKKVKIGTDEQGNDVFAIEAQLGLYSLDFVTAFGKNDTKGGGSYERLDDWNDYTDEKSVWVLSAKLGVELHDTVSGLDTNLSLLSSTVEGLAASKQDSIGDLGTIRSNALNGATAYGWGNHADKGYATETWVTNKKYLTTVAYDDLTTKPTTEQIKTILSISDWALAASKPSYSWDEIKEKPNFANVATSGKYSDLSGVPTKLSDFTDDILNGYYLKLKGGTLTGTLNGTDIVMSGDVQAAKVVTPIIKFADGATLEYDETNKCLHASVGIYSDDFITAFGVNVGTTIDATGSTYVKSITFVDGKLKVNYGSLGDIGEIGSIKERLDRLDDSVTTISGTVAELKTAVDNIDYPVTSVNNQTGDVTITAESIGALTQHQDISGKQDVISDLATIRANAEDGKTAKEWGDHKAAGYFLANQFTRDNIKSTLAISDWALRSQLIASDVPTLEMSKISGLDKALSLKLDAKIFNDIFNLVPLEEYDEAGNQKYALRVNYGLFSEDFVSAFGVNTGTGLDVSGTTYVSSISFKDGKLAVKYGSFADLGDLGKQLEEIKKIIEDINYPVTSVNGQTGAVQITASSLGALTQHQDISGKQDVIDDLGTIRSNAGLGKEAYEWGNHANEKYLKSVAWDDLTTKATRQQLVDILQIKTWALADNKPTYTWSEIGSRPTALSQFTDDVVNGHYLKLSGGTLSGTLNGTDIVMSGDVQAAKVVTPIIKFADGAILEYDETNQCLHSTVGIYSDDFITAFGVNVGTGIDASGTTYVKSITFADGKLKVNYGNLGEIGEIGELVADVAQLKDDVGGLNTRVTELENSATNVSVSQSLTSGVQIGTITIDGVQTILYHTDYSGKLDASSFSKANIKSTLGISDWALAETLSADAVPSLAISKITGLQTALDAKLDSSTFADLFEKVNVGTEAAPVYAIKAKYGFYSEDFVSAFSKNDTQGSGGADVSPSSWTKEDDFTSNIALAANLGWTMHVDLTNLSKKAITTDNISTQSVASADAVDGFHIKQMTQADYDTAKAQGKLDANTIYPIVG